MSRHIRTPNRDTTAVARRNLVMLKAVKRLTLKEIGAPGEVSESAVSRWFTSGSLSLRVLDICSESMGVSVAAIISPTLFNDYDPSE